MREVIDGKLYDTETAEELFSASHGYGGDFQAWDASLYRTKSGRYFLAGSGGAMSPWARSCDGNSSCGGDGIIKMSTPEAQAWVEAHGEASDYLGIWPDTPEA